MSIKNTGDYSCYNFLRDKIIHRINTCSSLYQMFGVLQDIFYYNEESNEIIYIEDISEMLLSNYINQHQINSFTKVVLKYGNDKIYDLKKIDVFDVEKPIFIHLEMKCYEIFTDDKKEKMPRLLNKTFFEDDLTADFSGEYLKRKLGRFLFSCKLIF